MKKTAVDFLSEKYMYVTWLRNRDEISAEQADKMRLNYLLEANEMHKKQIVVAYLAGDCQNQKAEEYYHETYNDNK
jgi:hypothetical protein